MGTTECKVESPFFPVSGSHGKHNPKALNSGSSVIDGIALGTGVCNPKASDVVANGRLTAPADVVAAACEGCNSVASGLVT